MPPRNSGMRKPAEERTLLAEFGKMFHVAKASHREHHNAQQAASAAAGSANTQKTNKSARKVEKDARPGSKRRSQHGGSIWMVLKGGFGPHAVPTASQRRVVDTRAQQRALLSERRRLAALKEAEAYVESAWQQARESELMTSEDTPTEEGDAYLAEQYATASKMLAPAPAGVFLHQLVAAHSNAATPEAAPAAAPEFALSRAEWEDLCTREAAILFRYRTSATPSVTTEEYFKEQQHAREQRYLFVTAEPMASSGVGVAPTKCVVRVRDSQRNKFTSILSSAKAVNYFKSNVGQVLRKELAGSKLPRGGAGDEGEQGASASSKQSQHHHNSNASGSANTTAAHSSKKKRKR